MCDFNPREPTWRRALRDTSAAVHSFWFWGAEVVVVAAASVSAVSLYPDKASPPTQALIQAVTVVGGTALFAFILLLGNFVVWSPRRQREEARCEVKRLNEEIEHKERHRVTREQLLEARQKLGSLMSDAGDMLIGQSSDKPFADEASEFFGRVLDVLREGKPIFDESHEGRFYAASTEAMMRADATDRDTNTIYGLRSVLTAEIACLKEFVSEINVELNSLAPPLPLGSARDKAPPEPLSAP